MILIASAAYVNAEFQIEFGRIPPSLLPVGNRRLFERQIEVLKRFFPNEPISLSLPESYSLTPKDKICLERAAVHIIRNDESLSLVASIFSATSKLPANDGTLRLLHGDTLLREIPTSLDIIGVAQTDDYYQWEVESSNSSSECVWCGYFSFSSIENLRLALQKCGDNFTTAVRIYNDESYPLSRVPIIGWHDFGHINTFFHSRAKLTTERTFNSLDIREGHVKKTGTPFEKINAEGEWFEQIPTQLKVFTPQLITKDANSTPPYYILEYLPLPPLNEVYVHGTNPVFFWEKIFRLCAKFLQQCRNQQIPAAERDLITIDAKAIWEEKTWERLDCFFSEFNLLDLDTPVSINGTPAPSLREIVEHCIDITKNSPAIPGVVHGDFCLSNILFDSRCDRIKVIDPRGMTAKGRLTIYGDLRYDLAKLTHSIVGLYDHIVAGAYDVGLRTEAGNKAFTLQIHVDQRTKLIQQTFIKRTFLQDITTSEAISHAILLFLSMLPLHTDDNNRQLAFLANALRLYCDINTLIEA